MERTTMARKHGNTATSLVFSPAEWDIIVESLRIASAYAEHAATVNNLVWPDGPMVERTRMHAESMSDIRERIEAR
jgi:hypothetical protein